MSLLSNKIHKRELKVGDHIYTYRKFKTYSHHGIYVEENRVIHYTRTESDDEAAASSDHAGRSCRVCGYRRKAQRGVVKSCLDCFLSGHKLYRFGYGVSSEHFCAKRPGTCSPSPCDNPDNVVRRATEMLDNKSGKFGEYDFLDHNCESFAVYCKTGQPSSGQALAFKAKTKVFFKNITEKPLTFENLANTAVQAALSYKINVLQQHAVTIAQQQQRNGAAMSSEEMDIVHGEKESP
ncbi:Endopeptidase, NLPC/P60 domain containing protein [Parasponia andersonii]|uniref:Endopeptidase, NLPC/P60 domain containing protein n=1 Tax=Parasponia andersonii TaxID=3476 RepID=A0A2P5CH47_PARAD|nr:Endopeptidase, NLPC/P60 domain containing protein [Parasponia andersonii]